MPKIKSAEFVKGAVGPDSIFNDMKPQIAFIGRSNVGKSSIINVLTGKSKLVKTSSTPGRTREINLFLINNSFYLVDLPGYGYAKLPKDMRLEIERRINWYLFLSGYEQKKIFLIIDAKVGPTKDDLEILQAFREYNKNILVIINKIDKVKKNERDKQVKKIKDLIGDCKFFLCSAKKNIGIQDLLENLMQ